MQKYEICCGNYFRLKMPSALDRVKNILGTMAGVVPSSYVYGCGYNLLK